MRFTLALLAAAAASVSATNILQARQAAYPNCAIPCLTSADFGSCDQTDLTCLCNSSAFITSTTQCIQSACTGTDLSNAEAAARSECEAVGVTLTSSVPPATSTAASSAPASAPASSAPASSTPASATSPSSAAKSSATSPSSAAKSSATAPSSASSSTPSASTTPNAARVNAVNVLAGAAALAGAVLAL
ncbi:hypothetical protein FA95DRAFT_1557721 [Auriscalpium vulgare]|uniref:Uncharacterized protein n=1 Tax=Auriscalpium vulgare TaxID=40419 RepID=A0ACB8RYH3_9AGAM|nr:hypothetical protein FA95DRAFT_1557721 [Auriscalpium vulgare]